MEPGPAAYFNLAAYDLTPELPLTPDEIGGIPPELTAAEQDLASHQTAIGSAVADLSQKTFALHDDLNVVEAEFNSPDLDPPTGTLQAIAVGNAETESAINEAEAAIPQIQSAPTSAPGGAAVTGNGGRIASLNPHQLPN